MTKSKDEPGPFGLRRLGRADAAAYRDLRLKGLQSNPETFAASFDDEATRSLAWFEERLQSRIVYGAFLGGDALTGVGGLRVESAAKLAHIGILWGMFVKPEARRHGVGTALVRRLIHEAGGVVEQVHLSVVASNEAAVQLYIAAGFKQYGLERRALKVGDQYCDEILMALSLNGAC
jgi:RimJ/RimL family protein N-acetyltransferase